MKINFVFKGEIMAIKKDDREWLVVLKFQNKDCPYLYFPANYHGCDLKSNLLGFNDECTLENCNWVDRVFRDKT